MARAPARTEIDEAYERTQSGDPWGYADWVRLVEMKLRASLRPFARFVDTEAILQEGLLRMWVLAPRLQLEGENASLRYALRMVRNLALREAKRLAPREPLDALAGPDPAGPAAAPDPPSDPLLRRLIEECLERLPAKPRAAIRARIASSGARPDRDLARALGMKLNTFLQNIVRARRLLAECLGAHGVSRQELGS